MRLKPHFAFPRTPAVPPLCGVIPRSSIDLKTNPLSLPRAGRPCYRKDLGTGRVTPVRNDERLRSAKNVEDSPLSTVERLLSWQTDTGDPTRWSASAGRGGGWEEGSEARRGGQGPLGGRVDRGSRVP